MHFNEDARVKIPALLHLVRLGYSYIPRNEHENRNEDSNIFPEIFKASVARLNPGISDIEIDNLYSDLHLKLDFDDLGRDFYETLSAGTGWKLFDFQHPEKNSYHVTTELTCKNGDEEFRPDITLLINGMPLVFIEVKKPNNKEGILAERKRMNERFANKRFKRFANITQLILLYKQVFNEVEQVSAKISMIGVFEKFGDSPLNLEQFGKVNGAAMIYPYIREHFTNLAVKAGLGLIFLPPVNLTK